MIGGTVTPGSSVPHAREMIPCSCPVLADKHDIFCMCLSLTNARGALGHTNHVILYRGMYVRMCVYMCIIRMCMYVCMYICMCKVLRSAGGLRHPLRSLRKKRYIKSCEADRRSILNIVFL